MNWKNIKALILIFLFSCPFAFAQWTYVADFETNTGWNSSKPHLPKYWIAWNDMSPLTDAANGTRSIGQDDANQPKVQVFSPILKVEAADSFAFYYKIQADSTINLSSYQPHIGYYYYGSDERIPNDVNWIDTLETSTADSWIEYKANFSDTGYFRLIIYAEDGNNWAQDSRVDFRFDYFRSSADTVNSIPHSFDISLTEGNSDACSLNEDRTFVADEIINFNKDFELLWYINSTKKDSSGVRSDTSFSTNELNDLDTLTATMKYYHVNSKIFENASDYDTVNFVISQCREIYFESKSKSEMCPGDSLVVSYSNSISSNWDAGTKVIAEFSNLNTKTWPGTPIGNSTENIIADVVNDITISTNRSMTPGKYYIRFKADEGTTSETIDSIIIKPLPSSGLFSDSTLCLNTDITIEATNGYDSYLWSNSESINTINATINKDTTFWIQMENNACINTDTINFTTLELPVITFNSDTLNSLYETDTLLETNINDGLAPYSYNWHDKSLIEDATEDQANAQTLDLNMSSIFYVTVTDNNLCSDSASVFVNVYGGPLQISTNDITICNKDSAKLIANTSGGSTNYSFTWKSINPDYGFTSNEEKPSVSPANNTYYEVEVDDGFNTKKDTMLLSLNPLPAISITPDTTICSDYQISLSASGGDSYSWSTGNNSAAINVVPADTTSYFVTVTNSFSCSSVDSVEVFAQQSPGITLPSNFIIPYFEDTVISPQISEGENNGYKVEWTPSELVTNPTDDTAITEQLTSNTTFIATITDNQNGCKWEDSITISVDAPNLIVFAYPGEQADKDTSICAGNSVKLNAYAEGGTENYSYSWMDILRDTISKEDTLRVSPDSETDYYLLVNDGVNIVEDTITVGVDLLPDIYFEPPSGEFVQNEAITITAFGGNEYIWENNPYIMSGLYEQSVSVVPASDTILYVNVTDTNKCSSRDSVSLKVSKFNWFVPEAFSPNGDNNNDILYVYGNGISGIHFRIYNKWGQLVFETREWYPAMNKSQGWDGVFNGNKQHNQTLGWVLEIRDKNGKFHSEEGIVTIIR